MSTTTENYNLIIPEGDDLFAPLNVEAPNFRSIDSNMWDNRLAGVQTATELISGSVHAITRETPDAPMFRYTATGAFNSGDTFTVDGISVQAVLPNGIAIEGGAYIEGCEVLAAVVGSKMTLYIGAGSGDADTLEGHPASYFGTAQRTEEVAALAQAANTTANAANSAAQDAVVTAAQALAAGAKFEIGEYTGDNTYGVDNPNSLTFGFVPKLVIIYGDDPVGANGRFSLGVAINGARVMWAYGSVAYRCYTTWQGNTLSWYSEHVNYVSIGQLNYTIKYKYIAIG